MNNKQSEGKNVRGNDPQVAIFGAKEIIMNLSRISMKRIDWS